MAKKYSFMAVIGADTSGFAEAVKKLDYSSKSLQRELSEINKGLKLDPGNITLTAQKMDALEEAADSAMKKFLALKNQESQMISALNSGALTADQFRQYEREMENARVQSMDYSRQLRELQESLNATERAEENAGQGARQAGENMDDAERQTKEYGAALEDLKSKAGKVGDDLKGIGTAIGAAMTAIGTAAVGGLTAAVSSGMSFEASMSKVQAISGATGEDFEKLKAAAEEMGATTSKTATESADALSYMALAGWDTQDMLNGLEPILRASEAGGTDLARTSDLVTDSMSAMGIATEDLTHYLDVVTAAQSNSNTSMEGLLEAYIGAGGTLRQLNIPIEESAAVLGTLANRGIKASEAGTSLNSIFVNLVGANKSAASAMSDLGVSAWDENGNFIGLSNTLKLLSDALSECTDEEKAMFEAHIGGKTQMDTLQALISGVNEEYDTLYGNLQNVDGALLETAHNMQDNLMGDLTTLKSALEGLGNNISEQFNEPLRTAVQAATDVIAKLAEEVKDGELTDAFQRLAENIGELITKFVDFAANDGLPALVDGLTWIIEHGEDIIGIVEAVGAAWATWKVYQLATDIKELCTSMGNFATAAGSATTAAEGAAAATTTAATAAEGAGAAAVTAAGAFGLLAAGLAAVASLVYVSSEFNTMADGLTSITAEARKSDDNIQELQKSWQEFSQLDPGLERYNKAQEMLDDIMKKEDDWNVRYKKTIDELNKLQEKKFKSASETARMKELQTQKESMDAEREIMESQRQALREEVGKYNSETIGKMMAAQGQKQQITANRGKTNKDVLAEIYNSKEYRDALKHQTETEEETEKKDEKSAEDYENTLKKKVQDRFRELETEQLEKGYDDSWLLEHKRAFLETLDHNSETYKEYNLKLLEEQRKFDDSQKEEKESAAKEEFDVLLESLENEEITREKFNRRYAELAEKWSEDQIDISEYTADKIADYDEKTRKEQLDAWEKSSKEITDKVTKAYEDVKKAFESAKKELSTGLIDEKVTDENGKDRYIFTDYKQKIKDLQKYQEDLQKLRDMGLSEQHMEQIMSLDYDSGERQGYINELLGMNSGQREKYLRDIENYYAELDKTAAAEIQDDINEADKTARNAVSEIYGSMPEDAYQSGTDTAKSYLQGIIDEMNSAAPMRFAGADVSIAAANKQAFSGAMSADSGKFQSLMESQRSMLQAMPAGNWLNVKTPINISIAGEKAISTTLEKLLSKNTLTGGNNLHV